MNPGLPLNVVIPRVQRVDCLAPRILRILNEPTAAAIAYGYDAHQRSAWGFGRPLGKQTDSEALWRGPVAQLGTFIFVVLQGIPKGKPPSTVISRRRSWVLGRERRWVNASSPWRNGSSRVFFKVLDQRPIPESDAVKRWRFFPKTWLTLCVSPDESEHVTWASRA